MGCRLGTVLFTVTIALPCFAQDPAPVTTVMLLTLPHHIRKQIEAMDIASYEEFLQRHMVEVKYGLSGLGCCWTQEGDTVIYADYTPEAANSLARSSLMDIELVEKPADIKILHAGDSQDYQGLRVFDAVQIAERRNLGIAISAVDDYAYRKPLIMAQTKLNKGLVVLTIVGGIVTKFEVR